VHPSGQVPHPVITTIHVQPNRWVAPPVVPAIDLECFVCGGSEGQLEQHVCKCKGMPIHLECQKEMLLTTKRNPAIHCAVCNSPYVNASVTQCVSPHPEWERVKRTIQISGCIFIFSFVIFLLGGAFAACRCALDRLLRFLLVTVSGILAIVSLIVLFYSLLYSEPPKKLVHRKVQVWHIPEDTAEGTTTLENTDVLTVTDAEVTEREIAF